MVVDFWRLIQRASDTLKNARYRASFVHLPPPQLPRAWRSEVVEREPSHEELTTPVITVTTATNATPGEEYTNLLADIDVQGQVETPQPASESIDTATHQPNLLWCHDQVLNLRLPLPTITPQNPRINVENSTDTSAGRTTTRKPENGRRGSSNSLHARTSGISRTSRASTSESVRLQREKDADFRLEQRRQEQVENENAIQLELERKRRQREEEAERLEREEEEETRRRRDARRKSLRKAEERDRSLANKVRRKEAEETKSVEEEVFCTKLQVENERLNAMRSSSDYESDRSSAYEDDVFSRPGSAPPTPKGTSGAQPLFGKQKRLSPYRPNSTSGAYDHGFHDDRDPLTDISLDDRLAQLRGTQNKPFPPSSTSRERQIARHRHSREASKKRRRFAAATPPSPNPTSWTAPSPSQLPNSPQERRRQHDRR